MWRPRARPHCKRGARWPVQRGSVLAQHRRMVIDARRTFRCAHMYVAVTLAGLPGFVCATCGYRTELLPLRMSRAFGCPRDDRRHWPRRYRSRQPDGAHSRRSLTWPSFDIRGSFGESCTLPMERFRWSGGSSRCQTRSARRSGGRGPAPTRRPPHRRRRTVLTTVPIESQLRRIERVRV